MQLKDKNIRYTGRSKPSKDKKTSKFLRKTLKRLVICGVLFLICIPISKTENAFSNYISKVLIQSSNIEEAKTHFFAMCHKLVEKYPKLEGNMVINGVLELEKEDNPKKEEQSGETTQNVPVPPVTDFVVKAAEEFTYPENVNMVMPINGVVTSPFGLREHPVSGQDASHYGVDIAGNRGDSIITTAPGKVIEVKVHDIYGNCVLIQHTNRIKSFYAHMDTIAVAEGDILSEGSIVGTVGSTGVTTGPHLHFGVRVDDEPTDPEKYIKMEHR